MKKLSNYSILLFLIFFGCFTNYGNVKSSERESIIHTEVYPNGNLKQVTTFTNYQGSMVISGEKTFFENGKLRTSKSYDIDGKPIQGIEYDENGKSTMWVH